MDEWNDKEQKFLEKFYKEYAPLCETPEVASYLLEKILQDGEIAFRRAFEITKADGRIEITKKDMKKAVKEIKKIYNRKW